MNARRLSGGSPAARIVAGSPARQGNNRNVSINVDKLMNFLATFQEDNQAPVAGMANLAVNQQLQPAAGVAHQNRRDLPEIPVQEITPILNRISNFNYTENDLQSIDKFSDHLQYRNAELFQIQVSAFYYKLVQQKGAVNPRIMEFDEVKTYLRLVLYEKDNTLLKQLFLECTVAALNNAQ